MKSFFLSENKIYFTLFLLIALFICRYWFADGYLLTLDMIFADGMYLDPLNNKPLNDLPVFTILHLLSYLIPAWVVQKIIIVGLFLAIPAIFYFSFYRFFDKKLAVFFSALFYLFNPFVYVRFLTGQWLHLVGFALLPWFFSNFFKDKINHGNIVFSLIVINLFSLHTFIVCLFLYFFYFLMSVVMTRVDFKGFFINFFWLCVGSVYWLLPLFLNFKNTLTNFDNSHFVAFATTGFGSIAKWINLLSFNGMWVEKEAFRYQFIWPQDTASFWIGFAFLFILFLFSVGAGLIKKNKHILAAFLLYLFFYFLAYFGFNFLTGFRDSHKFIAFVVVCFAFIMTYGIQYIYRFNFWIKVVLILFLVWSIFITSSMMWFGFSDRLIPVRYPQGYVKVRDLIGSEKTLVLPFKGYFSLSFNNDLLISNPSYLYFGPNVVGGRSIDLSGVEDQVNFFDYQKISSIVKKGKLSIAELQNIGFRYVILLEPEDHLSDYSYLVDYNKLVSTKDIMLFDISSK